MSDRIEGYATGIFELARAEGELDRVERELYSFARAFESSPELLNSLTDPRLPADRKRAVIDDLLADRAGKLTRTLAWFVVDQGRGGDFVEIADRLAEKAAASREQSIAEVRTAVDLDPETIHRIELALGRATGRQVEVRTVIDPSVVGGIVARVGDTVIDGSVRRRLESLRDTLKTR